MCSFLENWLPNEQAHHVGQVNSSRSSAPSPIVMKFLNYKDREKTLRTARKQKEVRYGNQRVSLFPDPSAETRQRQQQFDGVMAHPRAMDIRYGLLYHLVVTHNTSVWFSSPLRRQKTFSVKCKHLHEPPYDLKAEMDIY